MDNRREDVVEQGFKSGFIAILGRPNVGKSTLMNAILGEKISITSDRPQTTRNRILGLKNVKGGQLIFLDTPGIHQGKKLLNKLMVREALASLEGADLVLAVVDASRPFTDEDTMVIDALRESASPVFLVINKIDLVKKEVLLSQIGRYSETVGFREIIPVSAGTGDGIERLIDTITKALPEGPRYFPEDILTDRPEKFIAAEIIREKAINLLTDEIPYAVAVTVDQFTEKKDLVSILATIYVERDSQKGIIIGKGGKMLKTIGTRARADLEKLLDCRVYLELWVKVRKDWRKDAGFLEELGIE